MKWVGFIFIFSLSLRKMICLAASHSGVGCVSGAKKFLGQRTGTRGAGAGKDVVPGSVPAPGGGPGGVGDLKLPAVLIHRALPTPAAPTRAPHLGFSLKELRIFIIGKRKCVLTIIHLENPEQQREKSPIIPPRLTTSVDI